MQSAANKQQVAEWYTRRRRHAEDVPALSLALGISLLLPTLIFYLLPVTSQAPGVVLAAVILLGAAAFGVLPRFRRGELGGISLVSISAAFLIMTHLLMSAWVGPIDFRRAMISVVIFASMLLGASILSSRIFCGSDRSTLTCIKLFTFVFFLIGIMSVLGLQPSGKSHYFNPVFPFTEPSHYSLSFIPLLIASAATQPLAGRLVLLGAAAILAYLIQSLSLLIGVSVAALITLPLQILVPGALGVGALAGMVDVEYFADRLDFSISSGNLSVLVYLQGWDLLGDSLARTRGLGIGFQQLGIAPITTYTSSLIVLLAGDDVNVRDGGFTLAKIGSEFGLIGLLVVGTYTIAAGGCYLRLRAVALRRVVVRPGVVLALAFFCGFLVEMFVRGVGYFSGTAMIFIAAAIFLWSERRSRSRAGGAAVRAVPR